MKASTWLGALLTLSVAAEARGAEVKLAAGARKDLGVIVAPLQTARRSAEVDAFAKVLDPEPLVQLLSDLATARAAADASRAEAVRSRTLNAADGAVATKDMETARAQARADALKVEILQERLGLEWGPGLKAMSPARKGALVRRLSAGQSALLHVDTHNNTGQDGAKSVRIDIGDGSAVGAVLGAARAAEPRLQSSGLIVEVDGPRAILLSVGLTQSAHIETPTPQAGVTVPRSAVIRFRGSDWVYVQKTGDIFERALLNNPVPTADGLFVATGLAKGASVATAGVGGLFAAEQGASGPAD